MCREYGWELKAVKELDEIELCQSVNNAIDLKNKDRLDKMNQIALGTGAGSGNKHAVKKLNEIMKESESKSRRKSLAQKPIAIPLFENLGQLNG